MILLLIVARFENTDKLENRVLRRIEFCQRPKNRLDYNELWMKYKIELLCVRRKHSLQSIIMKRVKMRIMLRLYYMILTSEVEKR